MKLLSQAVEAAFKASGGKPNITAKNSLVTSVSEHDKEAWATRFMAEAVWDKASRTIVAEGRRRSRILMSHDGRLLQRSARIGIHKRAKKIEAGSKAGKAFYEQALIHECTWEEAQEWVDLMKSHKIGAELNIAFGAKIFKLREKVPDSTGPDDAARKLGTTVAEWLAAS